MSFSAAAAAVLVRRHRCFGGAFAASFTSLCSRTERASGPSPSPSPSPWLLLSSPTNPEFRYLYELTTTHRHNGNDKDECQGLKQNVKIHLPEIAEDVIIGSSHGFLISIPTCSSPDTIRVVNPLTGTHLPLPSPSLLPNPNPLNNCVHRCCKHWKSPPEWVTFDFRFSLIYRGKALLSPSLDTLVLLRIGGPSFARVGADSWTSLPPYPTHDAIFRNDGRLYTVHLDGDVLVFDLDDPSAKPQPLPLEGPLGYETSHVRRSLVAAAGDDDDDDDDDDGDLFLVFRDAVWGIPPMRTRWVKVFRLERKKKKRRRNNQIQYKWKQVTNIGDLALFVGSASSFALSPSHYPGGGLRPNTVYFTDNFPYDYLLMPDRVGDTGYFNLGDGTVHFFHLTEDGDHDHKLNWPPPMWFMPTLCC